MRMMPTHRKPAPRLTSGKGILAVAVLLLATLLGACSSAEHEDLESYVRDVKSRPPGRIAPMPEFETYETYSYQSKDLRNPFQPREEAMLSQANQQKGAGLHPDFSRHKEALENFPLDGLKFVGTLENQSEVWAIVKAPDNLVYRAKAGNHMGQNYGEVVSVDETRIQLVEIVPDGLGGWMKRQAAIAIEE